MVSCKGYMTAAWVRIRRQQELLCKIITAWHDD